MDKLGTKKCQVKKLSINVDQFLNVHHTTGKRSERRIIFHFIMCFMPGFQLKKSSLT